MQQSIIEGFYLRSIIYITRISKVNKRAIRQLLCLENVLGFELESLLSNRYKPDLKLTKKGPAWSVFITLS